MSSRICCRSSSSNRPSRLFTSTDNTKHYVNSNNTTNQHFLPHSTELTVFTSTYNVTFLMCQKCNNVLDNSTSHLNNKTQKKKFHCTGFNPSNSLPLTVHDQSLTITQFGAEIGGLLKSLLFCRAYKTQLQHLCDSLRCKDCCANTNLLTYFLKVNGYKFNTSSK